MEKDATEDSYARTVARFVAAGTRSVHRDGSRYKLTLTELLKEKPEALYHALSGFTQKRSMPKNGEDVLKAEVPKPLVDLFQAFFSPVLQGWSR